MDFMTKSETNALRIIEILYPDIDINGIEKYKEFFSTYNGLMPIVFECNQSDGADVIVFYLDGVGFMNGNESDRIEANYSTEPKFIEALQLACIKYLELKNEK